MNHDREREKDFSVAGRRDQTGIAFLLVSFWPFLLPTRLLLAESTRCIAQI
jgi:hypothetical protein